ncbi:hypothetical protein [Amycolatopsis sp.]|uniref:hypothetical protein n=1 Tax=Amycolatopsis sp. TaxID=37632 RepID=UPI0039C88ECB
MENDRSVPGSGMVVRVVTAVDVTLSELETFLPTDAETAAALSEKSGPDSRILARSGATDHRG